MDKERVSRRLKAARWLAGTTRNGRDQPVAMTTDELAQHPLLVRNRITASRLEEIEQERTEARPMELEKIALALGQPLDWFSQDDALSQRDLELEAQVLAQQLLAAARALGQAEEPEQQDEGGQGR